MNVWIDAFDVYTDVDIVLGTVAITGCCYIIKVMPCSSARITTAVPQPKTPPNVRDPWPHCRLHMTGEPISGPSVIWLNFEIYIYIYIRYHHGVLKFMFNKSSGCTHWPPSPPPPPPPPRPLNLHPPPPTTKNKKKNYFLCRIIHKILILLFLGNLFIKCLKP